MKQTHSERSTAPQFQFEWTALSVHGLGRARHYSRGDVIYAAGDAADSVYWVDRGRVTLSSVTEDGRELLIGRLGQGELFGEVAALLGLCHSEFATAAEDTVAYELKSGQLEALMMTSPLASLELCRRVCSRLRAVQGRLGSLLFRRVELRVRRMLVEMATAGELRGPAQRLSFTHQEIANLIGASRQETSRALKRLETDGLIALQYGAIVVKSPDALRDGLA